MSYDPPLSFSEPAGVVRPGLHGDAIPGTEFCQRGAEILSRINAAYPYPLYHLQELLPNRGIPADYIASFRFPALQAALAQIFSDQCTAERLERQLSAPIEDARERTAESIPDDAVTLVYDRVKGWHVVAARPIAAGKAIGNYLGDLVEYQGPGADTSGGPWDARRGFFERILDSYPGAARLSLAQRQALRLDLEEELLSGSAYQHLITLPLPDSLPIKLAIDPMKRGSFTRFLSHCDPPNLERAFLCDVSEGTYFVRIAFFTRVSIAAGEELTIDYGYSEPDMAECHKIMQSVHERIARVLG